MRAEYLRVGGTLAFVEQHGEPDAPPVLCLHTAGQSGVQWRHTAPALAARGYRVVVPDLPGHGRSEPAPGGPVTDLGDYAAWCLDLVAHLGLERPAVVGCSIGGKIALDVAVRAPDRLAGVVAMAADAHTGGRPSVRGLRRELSDVAAPSRTDRTHLGTLAVIGRRVPRERAELIATMHRREDPAVSTSDLLGWATHDLREDLSRITCPAHLVVGDDDLWLDVERTRRAAAGIPGARCTVLEGIGHYPMEEIADFDAVLDGWLRELAPAREAS
ncbi:alpha/beta fold hydrolase [Actinomycetospora sp. NBC_00405]|uniref:alpha/beta fold hydrolase n=1 Tax=Actinomycetospora sp. NBC_00405 TaxID=2975952 RepID=UPI002E1E06BD